MAEGPAPRNAALGGQGLGRGNLGFPLLDEVDEERRLEAEIPPEGEGDVVASGEVEDIAAQPGAQARAQLVAQGDHAEEHPHVLRPEKNPR